jgi:UDP-N-acetylmuramyl pentapeptide synthase
VNVIVNYTIDQIEKFTEGKLLSRNDKLPPPNSLSLDSRKIISAATTVFFAIKTAGHDANIFIENLYAKGVRNFVTSDKNIDLKKTPLANVILVDSVIDALQKLAAHHRKEFQVPVIGITGSNGKTIVKEWLNQLLDDHFSIVRSPKSYNSQIGVPLSVLNFNETHDLAIFEAGISRPGEMEKLEKIIQPSIGVFTNIGNAHDEGFKNSTQKINEKLNLFIHSKHLVFCADDINLKKVVLVFHKKIKAGKKISSYLIGERVQPINCRFYPSIKRKLTQKLKQPLRKKIFLSPFPLLMMLLLKTQSIAGAFFCF